MNAPDKPPSAEELLRRMDGQVSILMLVQGTLPDGTAHYAYASIPPSRYAAFKDAEAAGRYDLAAYGKILAHGEGKTPPADVQRRLADEYGADHRFEEDFLEWVQQLRRLPPE